jgi:hypothetical protein
MRKSSVSALIQGQRRSNSPSVGERKRTFSPALPVKPNTGRNREGGEGQLPSLELISASDSLVADSLPFPFSSLLLDTPALASMSI